MSDPDFSDAMSDDDTQEIDLGDIDPEDAYADDDPIEERVSVLERTIEDIRTRMDERREERRAAVDEIVTRLEEIVDRLRERVQQMREKLDTL